uniref:Uncharacterized protein n=1 Tax=Leptocylindrus danicus TaxID=163516 RepID=A0A7S2LLH6_9STRA|mmetsp:Transcript_6683/g.9900  ORF Transcript_6683/g.9900 Transcript_6683/m.9900 type:complete len:975 (+) Transcript_6683:285-3209(+)|eukprot:CAMPEP_0116027906 /NCGR_PEP_ID=MMETSP0321-20121206/15012_1 /TAXON_ID=163516 /ORGANISM="Leptocylindrus danicus var. danicus, Strain B650" /LENGTH=974 /DNA_ID=CAMNT_0003501559 /DNA_START=78 /DNA_END=3002 /DNA_ORIENTATION=-
MDDLETTIASIMAESINNKENEVLQTYQRQSLSSANLSDLSTRNDKITPFAARNNLKDDRSARFFLSDSSSPGVEIQSDDFNKAYGGNPFSTFPKSTRSSKAFDSEVNWSKANQVQWLSIRFKSINGEMSHKRVALPSNAGGKERVEEFRALLGAAFSIPFDSNIVGLKDVGTDRVLPLSLVCSLDAEDIASLLPVSGSFELLLKASPVLPPAISAEGFAFGSNSVSTTENDDGFVEEETPLEVEDFEAMKDFLVTFISSYTETEEEEKDDESCDTIMIPQRYSEVLQRLVLNGDGVIRAAYAVSEFCDDDEYLRCMMCTIAHNVIMEEEDDREGVIEVEVSHQELENILDVAEVLAEQQALPVGQFVALVHAILVRDETILHAHGLYKNVSDPSDSIDVLLGALFEIGLSLRPVLRSDKLVEVERAAEEEESVTPQSDIFDLAVVSAEKLVLEGRMSCEDKEILLCLVDDRDECLESACKLYIDDLNASEFESVLLLRIKIARKHFNDLADLEESYEGECRKRLEGLSSNGNDEMVDEENVSVSVAESDDTISVVKTETNVAREILNTATRIMVQHGRVSEEGAAALLASFDMGNPVLEKICANFVKGGEASVFMDLLEHLVSPIVHEDDFERAESSVDETRPGAHILSETISVLLSTGVVSRDGANRLFGLAERKTPEIMEALALGNPSKESNGIDRMIKALTELAEEENIDAPPPGFENLRNVSTRPSPSPKRSAPLPQAYEDYDSQLSKVMGKCVVALREMEELSDDELQRLVEMGEAKSPRILKYIDFFREDDDLGLLLSRLSAIVQEEEKSDNETACVEHYSESRPDSADTKEVEYEEVSNFSSSKPEVKVAAEEFVADLFAPEKVKLSAQRRSPMSKTQDFFEDEDLMRELLEKVKGWKLDSSETEAIKMCFERKDPALGVALASFRSNIDSDVLGQNLRKIASRVIEESKSPSFAGGSSHQQNLVA